MLSEPRRITAAALLAAGLVAAPIVIADEPPAVPAGKLQSGLSSTSQLLQLMDTDKSGKVSKAEFMRFMEAEFELADINKDGELDPKELKRFVYMLSHPVTHPVNGPGR
ncbi:MAG: EF-hand domain-containing protein [Steroidobacteraceae bacterium]|jgi:hypothetical protein